MTKAANQRRKQIVDLNCRAGGRKVIRIPASATKVDLRRLNVENPKKQIPKMDLLKEKMVVVEDLVDCILCDDPETEDMDVVDPFQALEMEIQMDDDTKMEENSGDVAEPFEAPKMQELNVNDLLMLANVALTHEDLNPH